MKYILLVFAFFVLFGSPVTGSDTLTIEKHPSIGIGIKLISERSGDYQIRDINFQVLYGGIQFLKYFKSSRSRFESGLYLNTKVKEFTFAYDGPDLFISLYRMENPVNYNFYYLTLPVNYRLETKLFYLSAGLTFDYLIHIYPESSEIITDSLENFGNDRLFYLGYNLNLGINKTISKKFDIFMESRVAVTISTDKKDGGFIMDGGNIATSHINYGFAVGSTYKFGK
ncbi:MAG: hypothetical protein IPP71_02675 [Bacteroidetes bacterium]|nr:hypothetical protein [Bacteroidota bacterium]